MSERTATATAPGVVELVPENIPEMFKVRPQWVNWKWALRKDKQTGEDKWTKEPYNPATRRKACTDDLLTWTSFDEVLEAVRAERFDGIGFVFCSGDRFVGIDFDKCRNSHTGEVDPRVLEYIKGFEHRYVEVSVSGTGVHLITRGKLRDGAKRGNYEIYGQERFFALTGEVLDV